MSRTEDPELVTGQVRYLADLELRGGVHAVFVRSDMAHAHITSIDTSEAEAVHGVLGVWTAETLPTNPFQGMAAVSPLFARPSLATGTVRFVGDPVAVVVGETLTAARDAAALVLVDYEPLPSVTDTRAAIADGAPVLFPDHGSNVAMRVVKPMKEPMFADADRVIRGTYVNQRMAVAPMEPHAAASEIGDDGRLIVYGNTQMPHLLRNLMGPPLDLAPEQIRVITPPVGGGFGGKAGIYPEQIIVSALALKLQRPVTWVSTRSEDMVALSHSRSQVQWVEIGAMADGTLTDVHVRILGEGGGYPGFGCYLSAGTARMANATYNFRRVHGDIVAVATNTTPIGAYRGAGRPEAAAMMERAVDQAARELGIDPVEIRRKNFLSNDVFPYTTHTGVTYDSGDYATPLDKAVEAAGYEALRAEQAERRAAGDRRLLGIGVSAYVEITAGGGSSEYASLTIHADGSATMQAGTSAHGQGHQTTFAMIVSERTGIPVERITLGAVDTDIVPSGGGTGGSRSLQLAGSAVLQATDAVVDKARHLAAALLEASVDDIVVDTERGTVGVAGVPASSLDWATLAARAGEGDNADAVDHSDGTDGLAAQLVFDQKGATFPFGAHIAVVEVDRDTGAVRLLRHIAVDDCGTVINPLLVEGQQHGGAAAGISQALYEVVQYDADGNPLTATFADYAVPSAAEFPSFEVYSTETPSPLNPLGAKGIGEATTIGSTPAVQNAVIDAVAHLGVRHIDLPCTSEVVWSAIRSAEAGTIADPWIPPPAVFESSPATATEVDAAGLKAAEGV